MSRAATNKGRGADKTKPPASQTPVIAQEIVSGKFNEHDWNQMVDKDANDEFVMDIMDDLMESTMTAIYNKYIERQLLPFTITQARDAITEIIEWQFLARDEGEQNISNDLGWAQDEEPEPAVTDCWAQGSVPKNFIAAPIPPMEEIAEEAEEAEEAAEAEEGTAEDASKEPPELVDVVSETDETPALENAEEGTEESKKDEVAEKKSETKTKSKTKFQPYRGKLKSAGVSKMTESLEESEMKLIYSEIAASLPPSDDKPSTLLNMPASCTSILKVQTGRPPGNKDVVYDDLGNVIAVMKLDPERLPTHKVNVKYHVVDPAVEAAQARLDAMRKGKSTGSKLRKMKSNKSLNAESVATGSKMKTASVTSTVAPLPPPLPPPMMVTDPVPERRHRRSDYGFGQIEEMEVSHGVVVREGGRVKKGPGRYYRKLDILDENQMGMKPVSLRITNPGITVSDLLDRHTPILRPLGESSPLPPIMPQPPSQPPQQAVQ